MPVERYQAAGLDYLNLVIHLLRRVRLADPTAGLWEAADLQWWWRKERASDRIGQTFWLDTAGPVAAVVFTDWGGRWGCDPIVVPGSPDGLLEVVWAEALARMEALALDTVEVAARDDDGIMLRLLADAGFSSSGELGVATSMTPAERQGRTTPAPGFRLVDRTQNTDRPHPFIARNGAAVEERLRQCSLYRADLDLSIEAPDGDLAAYGLFWFDPVTAVGFVEPMGTEEPYRRLGLARALLDAGLDRLASLGASQLKVNYEGENLASRRLYLGAGFRPASTAGTYVRRRSRSDGPRLPG